MATRLCSWLSEHLAEDRIISHGVSNLSLEEIYTKASEEIQNPRDICYQNKLFKILKCMFPCIQKSKRKLEDGRLYLSVRGLKFDTEPKESISFLDLPEFVPEPWSVLDKNDENLTMGFLSDEQFDGYPVLFELTVGVDGFIEVLVAGKSVDLSSFMIGEKIEFELKAVLGLFKCLKTICLCHGAHLDPCEPDIFSSAQRCVKEVCRNSVSTDTVIRHIDCLRVVPVTSLTSTCVKCSNYMRYRKRDYYKMGKSSNLEGNVSSRSDTEIQPCENSEEDCTKSQSESTNSLCSSD